MPRPPDPVTIHPHLARMSSRQRAWGGVLVEVAEFWCTGEVVHALPFADHVRLSAVLEEVGGPCEPRLRRDARCPAPHTPRHMHMAPAGMEVWGYTADARYIRDTTLVFDAAALEDLLGETLRAGALDTPRARFSDDALAALIGLLAGSVDDPDPSAELFGDGLATAIVARLFAREADAPRTPGKLAPWQLRRVADFVDAHLTDALPLARLAALVGISARHFARAFKATTGTAPHRWQLERRIARAQAMLVATGDSLEAIAGATGFVDASHFGRAFRRVVGATPGAWRRDRRR